MAQKTFQPLAHRLLIGVVFWSLLATALLAATQGWREFQAARSRAASEVASMGANLAAQLVEPLWQISPDIGLPILQTAIDHPAVQRLELFEISTPRPVVTLDRTRTSAATPSRFSIRREGREIGHLLIHPDPGYATRAGLRAAAGVVVLGGLAAVLPLAVLGWQLRRQLQRPMRQLSNFLDALQAERPDAQLVLDRPASRHADEFDRLVLAFGKLQARMAEHIQGLDAKVAERTEALQQAHDTMKALATTDVLTGCHNRFAFSQRFPDAVQHAQRYGRPLSLLFVDIDHFKRVNDTHGHAVGDQVLAAVGGSLREALRGSSDWVARYGGEEFVVVLAETGAAEALDVAERLRATLAQEVRVDLGPERAPLRVTASLGVAELQAADTVDSLLQRADACLYAAKHAGRDRVASEPALAG